MLVPAEASSHDDDRFQSADGYSSVTAKTAPANERLKKKKNKKIPRTALTEP